MVRVARVVGTVPASSTMGTPLFTFCVPLAPPDCVRNVCMLSRWPCCDVSVVRRPDVTIVAAVLLHAYAPDVSGQSALPVGQKVDAGPVVVAV